MGRNQSSTAVMLGTALGLTLSSNAALSADPKWDPNIGFEIKPGNERTLGEVDLFVPLWQDNRSMIFGNIRGMGDTDSNGEGNFGLGYRRLLDAGWIVGGYGFFDYRHSENNNNYVQGTLGIEALSVEWDIRANGYIPENGTNSVNDLTQAEVVGNQLFVREGLERALHGFNAEAGWRLPIEAAEVRLYGGGYWFDADGADTVAGPRGRLEVRINDLDFFGPGSRLTFGVEGQWDDPRGGQVFGLVRLRIPLGGSAHRRRWSTLSALERRMVERVERDVDIVVQEANGRQEPAIIDGRVVSSVHSVGPGGDLDATVETASGPNGMVIVDGTVVENNTVDMQPGQILAGGGTTFAVTGANSGATTTFTTPGAAGTISNTTIFPFLTTVVSLASNTTVTGLTISGGRFGIRGDDSDNASLSNVTVTNAGQDGILLLSSDNASLSNITVTNTGLDGIVLPQSGNASLSNVTVTNAGKDGIALNASPNANLSNITVTNTGLDGILLAASPNANLNNVTVTGAGQFGIRPDNSDNVSLSNVTITNAGSDGIFLASSNNFSLNNVTVTGAGADGISLFDSDNVSLNTVTINNPAVDGIVFGLFPFSEGVDSPTGSGNTVTNQGGLVCDVVSGTVTNSTLIVNGQPCP